jgi:uncharacterized protein (DUF1697 family)
MPRYLAFLRAINVGGHTVKMDALRRLFDGMGFSDVQTFIASGNVIFESSSKSTGALEKKIEGTLQQNLGYAVATFIRSTSELAAIARYKPFKDSALRMEGSSLYIAFMARAPGAQAKRRLMSFRTEFDDFHVKGREAYWWCRKNLTDSNFSGALLEKTLEMPATMRNSTTVKKMAALYA